MHGLHSQKYSKAQVRDMILQDKSVDRIKRRQQNRRTLASLHEPNQMSGSYVDGYKMPKTNQNPIFK